ncbi:MAG: hypothetical protein HJJLKODD_02186 [Phycisphaerae bacterium]|nr:hypothetical protein [Phycisphaerae bacterium]
MNDQTRTLHELREVVQRFIDERNWRQFHDPKNLAMSIAIESAELMEHFQWYRSEQLAELLTHDGERAAIAEEMADIFCYLLSLCNVLQVDLSNALLNKMVKNEQKYPAEQFQGRFRKDNQ